VRHLKTYTTSTLTRVEGRGRLEITMDKRGSPKAHFLIEDYRGFEGFLKGKMAVDIPRIVPRVCGMCSISQALASCKAIENSLGIGITQTAEGIRRLMLLTEIIRSHIVHVCFMMFPDLGRVGTRTQKELTMNTLELVRICDSIIRTLAGRNIHPLNCIIGGVSSQLDHDDRLLMQKNVRKALQITFWIQKVILEMEVKERDEMDELDVAYMGLQKAGEVNFYDGDLRVVNNDESVDIIFSVENYTEYITSNPSDNLVFRDNMLLLVGPLARPEIGSYPSKNMLKTEVDDLAVVATQMRLHEVAVCLTEVEQLLGMAQLSGSDIRIRSEIPTGRGIGAVEAPRGTLIHDFEFENGYVKKVRILVATSFNLAIIDAHLNKILRGLSSRKERNLSEDRLKRAIRSFDPCISCLGV